MWKTSTESNVTFGEIMDMSTAEENSYIALQILLFFIGIIGNSLVLVASMKYEAVSMDRTTVILIENIAAADLLITLSVGGVVATDLIFGRWVFGTHLCFILGYIKHAFYVAEFCLIILMGLCRLYCLRKPLSHILTSTMIKSFVSLIWTGSIIYIVSWPFTSAGIFYQPLLGCCMPALEPAAFLFFTAFHFVVMLIIFLTNVAILIVAKRYSTSDRSMRKATLTVTMVSWVFIGSYCPWLGFWGLSGAGKEVPVNLIVVGMNTMQINLVANPFIYSFTNRRFYQFLQDFIRPCSRRRNANPVQKRDKAYDFNCPRNESKVRSETTEPQPASTYSVDISSAL